MLCCYRFHVASSSGCCVWSVLEYLEYFLGFQRDFYVDLFRSQITPKPDIFCCRCRWSLKFSSVASVDCLRQILLWIAVSSVWDSHVCRSHRRSVRRGDERAQPHLTSIRVCEETAEYNTIETEKQRRSRQLAGRTILYYKNYNY